MTATAPPRDLHLTDTLRAAERQAAATLVPGALMQRAGAAAAEWIFAQGARRVRIICGPGNNGGDGYVCAVELKQRGANVACLAVAAPATEDARAAAARWRDSGGSLLAQIDDATGADLLVDAIFGIGLVRPLEGAFLAAARWLNQQACRVIALDVPSGLDADTGAWIAGGAGNAGEAGVIADATLTFITDKPGLHTGDGCDAAGEVIVLNLALAIGASMLRLTSLSDFSSLLVPRRHNSHKGNYGDVLVVGGGRGMAGAPLLAARAALRLGAGRVYVHVVGSSQIQFDPAQPELMIRAGDEMPDARVQVVGCGLGTDAIATGALAHSLARVDQHPARLVLDADALNLLAARTPAWRAPALATGANIVLTPHPLEAARLLAIDAASVQRDRISVAQRLAADKACVVVLKGAGTVIATPDGRAWINPTGGPALASAGTGDVLAGMIGALLAQCEDVVAAVLAAVWLHGAAADDHGADVGLVASDIAPRAAARLGALRANASLIGARRG